MSERFTQHGRATGEVSPLESALPKPGDRLLDLYELTAELGQGGMGQVWKARDLHAPRDVAIKLLLVSLRRHREFEAQVRATFERVHGLTHQNLGKVLGLHEDPRLGTFVVMDFIPGMSLREFAFEYRKQKGELTIRNVVTLLRPVAEALDYAHREDVVHRDVKPENIMVRTTPRLAVALIDLGIAAAVRKSLRTISNRANDTRGTLPYMSPEQLEGERPPQMDQYALAVVAYELLAAKLPLDSDIDAALIHLIQAKMPRPITRISEAENGALLKAMAKKPEARFGSCVEFIRTLAGELSPTSPIVTATVVPPPPVVPTPPIAPKFAVLPTPQPVAPPQLPTTRARSLVAPFDATTARAGQEAWAAEFGLSVEFKNSIGMQFRLIPPGEFLMGGKALDREKPVHRVRITIPFYLGVYPVTQGEYEQVLFNNPSHFTGDKRLPVEQVSWEEARQFLQRLTALDGHLKYRLPTEAEWEYACRAGTTTEYWFGDALNGDLANVDGTIPFNTNRQGTNAQRTTRVGSYRPNPFGLHDQHGNVWEWCADMYDERFYRYSHTQRPEYSENPQCHSGIADRVLRGGSWGNGAENARAAFRFGYLPSYRTNFIGFRAVVVPLSIRQWAER